MPSKDFYSILGVPKTATDDEIKKAFRRLAHEHHPDKGGDPQKFKDINEAYQILGDKQKRATYDQFGSGAFDPNSGFGAGGPGGGFGGFGGFEGMNINMDDLGDLGDMLGGMFGMGGRGSRERRGNDIQTDVTIDFIDQVKGVKRKISLYRHEPCSHCHGTGGEPDAKMETCPTCKGAGHVTRMTRTVFGAMQTQATCTDCHGTGKKPSKVCGVCKGTGLERKVTELEVDIPAGIADGEALKLVGQGEFPGPGGRAGDLYVRVRVKNHPTFSRDGFDVHSTASIPFSMLVMGGDFQIETVDGTGMLHIPEHAQPGTVFQIRHKGIPYVRSNSRGDHLVTVQPDVPKKLTKEQKHALEELKKSGL